MLKIQSEVAKVKTLIETLELLEDAIRTENQLHSRTAELLVESLVKIHQYRNYFDDLEVEVINIGEIEEEFDEDFGNEEVMIVVSGEHGYFNLVINLDGYLIEEWNLGTSPLENEWLSEYVENIEYTLSTDILEHFLTIMTL